MLDPFWTELGLLLASFLKRKKRQTGTNGTIDTERMNENVGIEPKRCQKEGQGVSNGDQTEPKGCQNEEGTSKKHLCGTGAICFWKRDAKIIPVYAKRVPQWSHKRCHKSFNSMINQMTKKRMNILEQCWRNDAKMEPEIIIVSNCLRKNKLRKVSVLRKYNVAFWRLGVPKSMENQKTKQPKHVFKKGIEKT